MIRLDITTDYVTTMITTIPIYVYQSESYRNRENLDSLKKADSVAWSLFV